jgi:hypothetical protein
LLVNQELTKKHTDKESEQRLKITELVKDLRLEEEKLLNTLDALNHSNEYGDKLQIKIDQLLIQFKETEKKHEKTLKEIEQSQDQDFSDL